MPQLLVRNVSDHTVEALKRRAAANQRSVETEHRALLEETLEAERMKKVEAFRARIDALHETLKGRVFTPSEVLVREMRDES
jgi:plasmid stability protein